MGSRYIPSGNAKVVFAPSISSTSAPTVAEINAGTVLTVPGSTATAGLAEMSNWETAASNIEVPDVASTFDKTIPGRTKAGEPSISFYDDSAGTSTVRTALAEGTAGYMVIMRYGQTVGKRAEVYPCKVSALNDSQVNNKNEPAMFTAVFAITDTPNKNASIS